VALEVLADQQQVLVVVNRKTLEASLIAVPLATGPVVGLQSPHLGQRDPPHEVTQTALFHSLEHKLPVNGQSLLPKKPAGVPFQSRSQDLLKSIVVLRLVELVRPGGAPVAGAIPPAHFVGVSWSAQAVV
jgi:hypothetical protein